MINIGTKKLETQRFILRRFVENDYEAMYQNWAKKEEIARYFPWNPMTNIDDAKKKMLLWVGNYEREDYYQWGITTKEDGTLIGTINLKVDENHNCAETCYIVAPDYWNKGVMTEVLKKVIDFGFQSLELNRISAEFFDGNEASKKVMMKCGMQVEGTARQLYYKNGKYIDSTWCSILKREYQMYQMGNVQIRKANKDDAKILAYIQTESWKSAFKDILQEDVLAKATKLMPAEEMYERVLQNPAVHMAIETVAQKPHCITAWGTNRNGLRDDIAELICIHSLPDQWRCGYGSMMMDHILSEMKNAGYKETILWVFEKNMRARNFYEKHGFRLSSEKQEGLGTVEVMYRKIL